MQRFEAMEPRRAAIRVLAGALPRDPAAMLAVLPPMRRSMRRMAGVAGLPVRGLSGMVADKALPGVWFATQRVWRSATSTALAPAMPAPDRNTRPAWPPPPG